MADATRPFGSWRLRGGRYDTPGLPVEMLSELALYQRLVLDVAQNLYKQRHPLRRRIPRGFSAGFDLRLTEVRHGSVVPVLETPILAEQDEIDRMPDGIFDESRLLIQNALRMIADEGALPRDFPIPALREFARFGRSLKDDEFIVFDEGSPAQATYSREVRRKIQAFTRRVLFEVEVVVVGQITGLLADRSAFEIRLSSTGRTVAGGYSADDVFPDLVAHLGSSSMAPTVALNCVALQDRDENILEIKDVLGVEPVLPEEWSARLKEIAEMPAGWYDGSGEPISRLTVRQAETLLLELLENGVHGHHVYPMPDGGIQLEWPHEHGEVSMEIKPGNILVSYYFNKRNDGDDRELTCAWRDVDRMVAFIREGIDVVQRLGA
ncbi:MULTISPECIES: hypothetical protein [unclassified Pseudofrankia]|uniref:hypothetical protein n=1 Tax=unclassified Pseudofrankia TaxID=2994372 RepID=UPI0008DA00E5|nr:MULTISPECIES: hypothetical protein [unclassified Pseudofrankia]MDT3438607.1 hypothetical protein [Pseudofrankia sp. BMG5.37]OHV49355.1 hypothetical protein BCD48_12965 [Pseudofrankia sp. BMG5.36]